MDINFIMAGSSMSGGDRVCAIYAKKLIERGHHVNVIAPKAELLTFRQQLKRIIKGFGWKTVAEQLQNHFDLLGIKVTYLESKRPVTSRDVPDADVIIATWWLTSEWINEFPESKGVKVHFVQGHENFKYLPIKRVTQVYRLPFYKITIANWLVDILEQNYNAKHVSLVPNSVDLDTFFSVRREKQSIPTIGFLFSETECKGVAIALKVIERLKLKILTLRVISFGMNKPQTITLPDYIELEVNPTQDKIRGIYEQCDVWLCCSLSEGFGLTILEAMACRTPAVSTKCGGPEDIISHGENGYLCDINDVNALTESVFELLSLNEENWLKFSDKAYQHAISYTWDDAATLFELALQKAVTLDNNSQSYTTSKNIRVNESLTKLV
ncbi:glycosyltransferase family 4 protein [Methylobacter sp.]|uniref:glycosyltransferase family 4 protein n=1 Tax=Methylobacter sp. TaxID=2051955 RepID=UPI003DA58D3F